MKWFRCLLLILPVCFGVLADGVAAEEWRGSWIWCEIQPSPKNFYLYCRKTFDIVGEVNSATLSITADSRYKLYVNGSYVNCGPIRSDPRWQSYDVWDIQPFLRDGRNAICVLVHHYGEGTGSYILGRGGLMVDGTVHLADGQSLDVLSDNSWKVMPAESWTRDIPRMNDQLGFSEIFDANTEPSTWKTVGFDDSHWASATILGSHPQEPWRELVARDIPPATETQIYPKEVLSMSDVVVVERQTYIDLGSVISPMDWAVGYVYTQVYSDVDRDLELVCGSNDGLHIWLGEDSIIERDLLRTAAANQDRINVTLKSGWTPLLAKVTQAENDWELYLRFEGEGSESLRYSSTQDRGQPRPVWHIIGPFDNEGQKGFSAVYPPEDDVDLSAVYEGKAGKRLAWQRFDLFGDIKHPAIEMSQASLSSMKRARISDIQNMLQSENAARINTNQETGISLIFDFGYEVFGYPEIDILRAQSGAQINLGYSESLTVEGGVDPHASDTLYADRYICRAGPQTFRTFEKRAFRYLRLDIYNTQGNLDIASVRINYSTYPVKESGAFICDDEVLNAIWRVGANTIKLNMDDAYTDSPWRGRVMRCGDTRIESLCNGYAFGDVALLRRCIRLIAQSQLDDGRVLGMYPTESNDAFIADYALIWVSSIWDYYYWTGDASLIEECFPAVMKTLNWFAEREDKNSLLAEGVGWVFIDWASLDKAGACAALNAFYYKALCDTAAMAGVLDQGAERKDLDKRVKRLKKAFHSAFWNKNLNVFSDARRGDELSDVISQHTNALAILFGLASQKETDAIIPYILNPDNNVVEIETPYFTFYLLDALFASGKPEAGYNIIRRWGEMLGEGATTWREMWKKQSSSCHGWSSAPTYFLPAYIAGIRLTSPGWKTAIIEPEFNDLKEISAIVPTPRGDIAAKITQRSGGYVMAVDLSCPDQCQTIVSFPLKGITKSRILVDGKKEIPANVEQLGERDSRLLYRVTGPASMKIGLQNVPR